MLDEVAENSYKTGAIGGSCARKGGSQRQDRECENIRRAPPVLAMSHADQNPWGGRKKIKYPLLCVHVDRFSLNASRCFSISLFPSSSLLLSLSILMYGYRCVRKDNIIYRTKDLVSDRDRFMYLCCEGREVSLSRI